LQWYKKQALVDFARRLALFSTKLGVAMPTLILSSARTRWGSCNSRKEVRLNWRLLQAPPHLINYVICHELAHLKQMNHSAKFWAEVASIYPDYKSAEKELKAWSPKLHVMWSKINRGQYFYKMCRISCAISAGFSAYSTYKRIFPALSNTYNPALWSMV